ncbi:MAG: hypothetical protein AAF333_10255 [Planctomycetota bacterium]
MIKFRCGNCQKKIGVPEKYAGRAIKCPGCETRLSVPKPPEPEPEAVSALDDALPDLAGLAALEAAAAPAAAVGGGLKQIEAPGRTCPSCGAAVSDKAVICISCGHSFKGKGKKLDTKVVRDDDSGSERKSSMGGPGRMILGLVVTSVVGIICCVGWLIVTAVTGFEVGLIAWAIGGIIGLTAGLIGRNPSPIYCGLTAVIAGASIVGAKVIIAATMSVAMWGASLAETIFDEFSPQRENLFHAVMQGMLNDGEFSGAEEQYAQITTDIFFGVQWVPEPDSDSYFNASWDVDEKVEAKLAEMSEAEQEQELTSAQARHPSWVGDPFLYQAAVAHLVEQEALPADVLNHGKQTVVYYHNIHDEADWEDYNDDYGDWLENDVYMKREFDLIQKTGEHVATLDTAQRQQLIADTKAAYPSWISSEDEMFGDADAELESFQAEMEEEGISSDFGRNFLLTLGAFDLIFLALAVGTAYSVAYAKGA